MDINGLIDSIQLYIDIQELQNIGLSAEEVEGYVEFEWDIDGIITQQIKQGDDD